MALTALDILNFMETQAPRPLSDREILGHFELSRRDRQKGGQLLQELAEEGTLVRLKGNRYSLPRQVNLVVGTVQAHRDGYGFVTPSKGEKGDVFIPARYMRQVMNGDRVVVRIERGFRSGRPEGRVIRVLERAHQTVVGRYETGRRFGYVVPSDPRLTHDVFIPAGGESGARPGQIVIARLEDFPAKNRNPEGVITRVLGDSDDPEVEMLTIVHQHGLPYQFPPEVTAEAEAIPDQVREEDLPGREDLRELPFMTIDGETAKDFDDAVTVREEKGGRIRLWVAIADVGHYVREGSPIDQEAYERGTSVYFPGRAIPMLPEKLSNGICSLNPKVDRLTMVAEMLFDGEGQRVDSRFYPALIQSQARLTYTAVKEMLDGDEEVRASFSRVWPQLPLMQSLAERLMAMRRKRGSLDFDLPEAEIVLDLCGRPENIVRAERNIAHRIIEEFMLAANEAVATFLSGKDAPLLYRVHEPPDPERLQALQEFVAHFNYGLVLRDGHAGGKELQALLAQAEGTPEERMINQVLLRSMKQAHYSDENVGHFGLASDLYCHFTSPIRRYPDLVVHRVLRSLLQGRLSSGHRKHLQKVLPQQGEHTSQRERRAMEAERDVIDLHKARFMADKVGDEFDGFIAGVQPFGIFVELKDIFVEGLVHISSLEDDFYHYEEDLHRLIGQNRRREFQVGAGVRVRVKNVNIERREIDLELADAPPQRGAASSERGGAPSEKKRRQRGARRS